MPSSSHPMPDFLHFIPFFNLAIIHFSLLHKRQSIFLCFLSLLFPTLFTVRRSDTDAAFRNRISDRPMLPVLQNKLLRILFSQFPELLNQAAVMGVNTGVSSSLSKLMTVSCSAFVSLYFIAPPPSPWQLSPAYPFWKTNPRVYRTRIPVC